MIHVSKLLLALGLILPLYTVPAAAETQKFAVLLGNNIGHDPSKKLNFAEQDIVKIRNVLVELGGFEQDNIALLLGRNSKQAWKAIEEIEAQLEHHKRKTGAKTLLFFYFSGHADGDVLELGSSSLQFSHLRDYLRASMADVRLAFLDSCLSGNIIAAKGGKRGPEYTIELTDEITAAGYAIVTSSAFDELSQESTEVRGAFFTHYLISALRGAGDKSEDGKVTLSEAYQYAYNRTLARTSTTLAATQHPMFEYQLQGRGDIVITNTNRNCSSIKVKSPHPGRIIVLNESENNIVAELALSANKDAYVAVRPGNYRAYLLTKGGSRTVRFAKISVPKSTQFHLKSDEFQEVVLKKAATKGGLFTDTKPEFVHRLGIGGLWRYWSLKQAISSFGTTIHYRLQTQSGFEPGLKASWTTLGDKGPSTGYHDFGLSLIAGYAQAVSWILVRFQVAVGYEHMIQDRRDGIRRGSPCFSYQGLLGTEVTLTDTFYVALDFAAGARVFKKFKEINNDLVPQILHREDVQVVLSFGFRWTR